MRIGHGFDVHGFEKDKPLILCGVEIPHSHGLKAHSDGDVAIHALCDAMLGAAALGDIGRHFPDTKEENRDRNSQEFLRKVNELINDKGLAVNNLDLTIIAQKPRLAGYISAMRNGLATVLQINMDAVNIKATTTEGLGFVGREEGIVAHAVVLLKQAR